MFYLQALEIEESLGRKEGMARAYVQLGGLKAKLEEFESAQVYWNISIKLYKEIGASHLAARIDTLAHNRLPRSIEQ